MKYDQKVPDDIKRQMFDFFNEKPRPIFAELPPLDNECDIKQRSKDILAQLLDDLETGKIFLEDLGCYNIRRLKACLDKVDNR